MSKRRFIQDIVIRSLPPVERIPAAVSYAERVWDELTRHGYGAPKQAKPRDTVDHYGALSQYQRDWFDQFWQAFGYKAGRNRAALAWGKLGELAEADYRRIIDAAKAESLRPRKPSETRKMAEGWLSERRFDDASASHGQKKADANRARKLELNSQLNALKQFNADGANDAEIERLQQEIAAL